MKILLFLTNIICLYSCQPTQSRETANNPNDSFEIENNTAEKARYLDSMNALSGVPPLPQTLEEYMNLGKSSPVIVTGRIVKESYANKVHLVLKNTSNKTVDGVKLGYSLYNNFDENVSGNLDYTWVESQETVYPKSSTEVTVTVSREATKINHLFVNQIHFTDGTDWKGGN